MDETTKREGAPDGNDNAHVGCLVRGAFRRALAENEAKGRQSLLLIAHGQIAKAEQGDTPAAKLVFDKVGVQPGSPESPIAHTVTHRYGPGD